MLYYRILIEVDLAHVLLNDATSGPKELLNREIQVIEKELEAEILQVLQDSATSGPKGSPGRDPKTDLAQVVEKDPDTEILHKWPCRNLKWIFIQSS